MTGADSTSAMNVLRGPFIYPGLRALWRASEGDATVEQFALAGLTRTFAVGVVFIAGWYLALPETELVQIPWWAAKHRLGPNILVHEALFAAYLVIGGLVVLWRHAVPRRYLTLSVSSCLVALAVWGATMSLLGPLPAHDVGRSARLVLMAALVLAVTHWAAANPLLVLRSFLLGLTGASVANLVLTFMNPVIMAAGALPRLLGQNSPGPPMGIAVCLAAWLILVSRSQWDTVLAVSSALICGVGAMISYSKTGMLAAGMGFMSLALVSGRVAPSRRGRVVLIAMFAVVLGGAAYLRGDAGVAIRAGFSEMLQEKLESAQVDESVSMQQRMSYWKGVGEILVKYPLGVGFSGFRDAMIRTDAYATGLAADEGPISAEDSNPHAMFLYYASAGGFLGGLLALGAFFLLCRAMLRGLGLYGAVGVLLALLCSVAYVVLAISVPYLFNSTVMLVPAAVAAGVHARIRDVRRALATGDGTLMAPLS